MITRLIPSPSASLSEDDLLTAYRFEAPDGPRVRFNFVSSADGAATLRGRAGGLGNATDQRILHLLRRTADVLVLGAGTVRAEGYGGELLDPAGRAWREAQGRTPRPAVAIVSGSLDLDPGAAYFTDSPVRPIVFTTQAADPAARAALDAVADVVVAGEHEVSPADIVAELAARGYRRILSEGGPRLFASFQRARMVDELCLTVGPLLVGGPNPRIAAGALENTPPMDLTLAHVVTSDGLLFLRYLSDAGSPTQEEGIAS